jgi:hypothetical protein
MRQIILRVGYIWLLLLPTLLPAQTWSPALLLRENGSPQFFIELGADPTFTRLYLIWTENEDKKPGEEVIYCATIENGQLQLLRPIVKAPPIIQEIGSALIPSNNIYLVWGTNAIAPTHPVRSYTLNCGVVRPGEGITVKNIVAARADSFHFISNYQIRYAPSGRILACWHANLESTWIREQVNGNWMEAYQPYPNWKSPEGRVVNPDLQATADGMQHLAFIGNQPGLGKVAYPLNFIWYAAKHESETDWPQPASVYRDTTQAAYYPTLRIDSRGVRHIIWFEDSDVDLWPENLYYAYSHDGKTWSKPIDLTRNGLKANIIYKDVVVDRRDQLHLVWEQQSFDYRPQTLKYIVGREENWSQPTEILREQQQGARVDPTLALDRNDRLHLVWEEVLAPLGTRYQILYSWLDLATAVDWKDEKAQVPKTFTFTATPNPFHAATTLQLEMAAPAPVSVQIANLTGQLIRTFNLGARPASNQTLHWDGRNEDGILAPSGMYFVTVRLQQASQVSSKTMKLILLR